MIDRWTALLWIVTAMDWEVRHARVLVVSIALGGLGAWRWVKAEAAIEPDLTALDDLLTPTREEQ